MPQAYDSTNQQVDLPAGTILSFTGSSLPSNYLLCDGQPISRTTYATLFAAIGTTYGAGDGSTTFNKPNMIGRTPIGAGNYNDPVSGSVTRTLGQSFGAERHTLTTPEMPSHTHTAGQNGNGTGASNVGFASGDFFTIVNTINAINPTGGDASHNNMQPSLVVNWMIKF